MFNSFVLAGEAAEVQPAVPAVVKEEDEDGVVDVIARSPSPPAAALIDKGTTYGPFPAALASSADDGELVTTVSTPRTIVSTDRRVHFASNGSVDIFGLSQR